MRDALVAQVLKYALINRDIYLITGDLGFGVLDEFSRKLPEQFINAGVAEQNMTGVAAGLALDKRLVFTYSIANFPTMRCLEQIRNDVLYHGLSVNVIGVGGGFSYGQLGMSHHATEDIGVLRPLPRLRIYAPCDISETIAAVDHVVNEIGPSYIRIDKSMVSGVSVECSDVRSLRKLRDGKDVLIVGYGGILQEAIIAAESLMNSGISCAIYSAMSIKPFSEEEFVALARQYDCVVTLEEHSIIGGLASVVAETYCKFGYFPKYRISFAIADEFCSIVGSQAFLRDSSGISSNHIISKISSLG